MIERRERKDGAITYRVRYRTPDGHFRSRSFRRRGDAVAYEREMEAQKRRGDWVDPQRGRITLAMVWQEYERSGMTHLRVTTQNGYRYAWKHIEPTFGRWPVAKIEHADVAEWVSELSRSVGDRHGASGPRRPLSDPRSRVPDSPSPRQRRPWSALAEAGSCS